MLIAALLLLAPAAGEPVNAAVAEALREVAPNASKAACKSAEAEAIVVCGRQGSPYRIDPVVLGAQRAAEAPPGKKSDIAAASKGTMQCVGLNNCGAGTVPLVAAALAAAKAAALAAQGEDWREAFRTGPTGYQRYEQSKSQKPRLHVRVGGSSAN